MNGINTFIKETPASSLTPFSMWGQREGKMAIYETGSRLSQDTESTGDLILDLPASRTIRNQSVLLINHTVYIVARKK